MLADHFSLRHRVKAPSFKGYKASSQASSRAKQANRSRDTSPELLLRRALWRLGLRFRTNSRSLPGRPDIVFPTAKLVVFCDGDFWHGRNWSRLALQLKKRANAPYWMAKIAANRSRDITTRSVLRRLGWQVVRFWETEIKDTPEFAALQIKELVDKRIRMHR